MNTPRFEHEWERRLHQELRRLPEHEAPPSLVADVLAAIQARQQLAWYRRPAFTWPWPLRAALVLVALALLIAMAVLAQGARPVVGLLPASSSIGTFFEQVAAIWAGMHTLVDAVALALRSAYSPLLFLILAIACLSYLALFGLGSALWRVTTHLRT